MSTSSQYKFNHYCQASKSIQNIFQRDLRLQGEVKVHLHFICFLVTSKNGNKKGDEITTCPFDSEFEEIASYRENKTILPDVKGCCTRLLIPELSIGNITT